MSLEYYFSNNLANHLLVAQPMNLFETAVLLALGWVLLLALGWVLLLLLLAMDVRPAS